jgi:hypothetical protein
MKFWVEYTLAKVVWPINSQTVDLDKDGDIDIIGGSVALKSLQESAVASSRHKRREALIFVLSLFRTAGKA